MNEPSQTTLPYILGTAGHIDHGKTSLIKMLTGIETDRLAEEKQRGITIELGFASLDLGNNQRVGVVDVPGHERFVRQMIAGATGIDCALLVIAADDGVMPQTREHTQIMELLGVTNLIVALTKIDLVDPEWIELVTADIENFLDTTRYSEAPIIPCSSVTEVGKEELLKTLADTFATITRSHSAKQQLMRLPIDRVFTLKGAGTVVTGTLWSGTLNVDDEVEIYPHGLTTRARSIQVHNTDVDKALPGQRTAVNLVGVAKEEIHRGDTLCTPGSLRACTHFDSRFTYVGEEGSDREFVSGTRVHINHGTTEVLGRILLLDEQQALSPRSSALVQIRLEEPLALRSHDRFIVRSYSPVHMIGGGEALLCSTARRTVLSPQERELLDALEKRSGDEARYALLCSSLPRSAAEIAADLDLPVSECAPVLDKAAHTHDDKIQVLKTSEGTSYISTAALDALLEKIENILREFHEKNPHLSGMSESSLNALLDARITKPVFLALLDQLNKQNKTVRTNGLISHTSSGAHMNQQLEATKEALRALLSQYGLAAPFVDELARILDVDKNIALRMLTDLTQHGEVQKISPEYYVLKSQYDRAVSEVREFIAQHGPATTSQLREMLNISRKFAIPLLTAFDTKRITKRNGDTRELW